jgi:hypothetical protein
MTRVKRSLSILLFGLVCLSLANLFVYKNAQAASVLCRSLNENVVCSVDGNDPIVLKPFESGMSGYRTYYADAFNYNNQNHSGDFYVAYMQGSSYFGVLYKFHSDGKNSTVVFNEKIWAPNGNTLSPFPADGSVTGPSTTPAPDSHNQNSAHWNVKGKLSASGQEVGVGGITVSSSEPDLSGKTTFITDPTGLFGSNFECNKNITFTVNQTIDNVLETALKNSVPGLSLVTTSTVLKGAGTVAISPSPACKVAPPMLSLAVSVSEMNAFDRAIQDAVTKIVGWMNAAIRTSMKAVDWVLGLSDFSGNIEIQNAWKQMRNAALSLLTLGILIIAFANILQIDQERYGLNRMLPRLIIAVVLTYFSFFIAKITLELTFAFQQLLKDLSLSTSTMSAFQSNGILDSLATGVNLGGLEILVIITSIILLVATLWLLIILLVRIALIWVLVILSPLAYLMMVMPFTEQFWKRWWQEWWKWIFMGPAVMLLLYISSIFITAFGGSVAHSGVQAWLMLILAAVCIFIAATLPLTMGVGQIWKSIQSGVKSVRGGANVLSRGDSERFLKTREANRNAQRQRAMTQRFAKLSEKPGIGRFVTGADELTAAAFQDTAQANLVKELSTLGGGAMISRIQEHKDDATYLKAGVQALNDSNIPLSALAGQYGVDYDANGNLIGAAGLEGEEGDRYRDQLQARTDALLAPHMANPKFKKFMLDNEQGMVTEMAAMLQTSDPVTSAALFSALTKAQQGKQGKEINHKFIDALTKLSAAGNEKATGELQRLLTGLDAADFKSVAEDGTRKLKGNFVKAIKEMQTKGIDIYGKEAGSAAKRAWAQNIEHFENLPDSAKRPGGPSGGSSGGGPQNPAGHGMTGGGSGADGGY